jgi:hypothetical protein
VRSAQTAGVGPSDEGALRAAFVSGLWRSRYDLVSLSVYEPEPGEFVFAST